VSINGKLIIHDLFLTGSVGKICGNLSLSLCFESEKYSLDYGRIFFGGRLPIPSVNGRPFFRTKTVDSIFLFFFLFFFSFFSPSAPIDSFLLVWQKREKKKGEIYALIYE